MAIFYDIVYDSTTKRHKLEFVNQQHDGLMGIRFDDKTGTYRLDVPLEFAQKIFSEDNGGVFDSNEWLTLAQKKLTEADTMWPEGKPS